MVFLTSLKKSGVSLIVDLLKAMSFKPTFICRRSLCILPSGLVEEGELYMQLDKVN